MQALLSYDQSPPMAAPFRFFLSAPVFGVLAGLLLVWSGPSAFLSRWTPEALALTHLITAGFMLQVMLGALIQVLPVVAGANLARPLLIARIVHAAITLGAGLLAAAFLTFRPWMFIVSSLLFVAGGSLFVGAAAWAMRGGVSSGGPTVGGLKYSIFGLAVTVAIGVAMAFGMAGWFNLPLLQLTDIHLGWGFVVWGLGLLAAVAYVVVPMFQITPAYPSWLSNRFAPASLGAALVWSVAVLVGLDTVYIVAALAMVGLAGLFAGITLALQRRSKRPRFDTNQYCWRGAMACVLAAAVIWLGAMVIPVAGDWVSWPILCGVLLMFGGFVSVITGMLYKIVPFLVWLHLQNLGGVRMAPNMKKVIDERNMHYQMLTHFVAVILLTAAVFLPAELAVPAGIAVMVSQAWLGWNLWSGVRVFCDYRERIVKKSVNS